MPVFKVYLNGKKVSTAGVGHLGVLSAIATSVRHNNPRTQTKRPGAVNEVIALNVSGLIAPTDEHVRWLRRKLKIGDEVRIKIVELAPVDRPRSREPRNRSKELRAKKQYVRKLAREFGWKIHS